MLPFSEGPAGVEHGVHCLMVLQLFSPLEQPLHPLYLVVFLSCGSGTDTLQATGSEAGKDGHRPASLASPIHVTRESGLLT